jgi:large repetitive protein
MRRTVVSIALGTAVLLGAGVLGPVAAFAGGTTPGAPTIESAVPGDGSATVTFDAPGDDGGSAITVYTASCSSTDGGDPGTAQTPDGTVAPLLVSGLTNGNTYTCIVTATNANGDGPGSDPSSSFVPYTVPDAPTIGTATGGDATASVTFTAPAFDGGSPITSYTAECASHHGATGSVDGAASPIVVTGLTNGSTYTCSVTATNLAGSGDASADSNTFVPYTVPDAPTIGTATGGNAAASVTFTAPAFDGGSPITGYTATCLSSNGGATGSVEGGASPIVVTGLTNGSTYTCTVTAANLAGSGAASGPSNAFTLSITQPPVITSASSTEFTVGSAGTFTVTTTGNPVPTLSKTGKLPSGVTYVDNHDGTGTLAGTVPSGKGGTYLLVMMARNSKGTVTQAFTLVVGQPPVIKSAALMSFTAGTPGSFAVTTAGYPVPALSQTGALPSGVTFVDNGNGTATLAGSADPGTGGVYPLVLTASSVAGTANQNFTLTINEAPGVTSATGVSFAVGSNGTFTVTTSGFPHPAISKAGKLPAGVTFVDNHDGTATLSGTPAAGKGGSYPLTITAKSSRGTATQSFSFVVTQVPTFKNVSVVSFNIGVFKSFTISTAGYPVPALSQAGALPSGLTFVDNGNGTATLSGTAAVGTGGAYSVVNTATSTSGTANQNFTILVQ